MRSFLVFGTLFLFLALLLHIAPNALIYIDERAAAAVTPWQTLPLVTFFLIVTVLGSGNGIMAIAAGFVFTMRLPLAEVFRLVTLLLATAGLNRFLKDFFARTRPDAVEWVDPFVSFSFPSAHASAALALYGFVALFLYERTRSWLALTIPALVILLVGLSRIVLGAHHATDVVGGYLLGASLLALALLVPFERVFKRYG